MALCTEIVTPARRINMLLSPLIAWALGALLGNKPACLMNSVLLNAEPIYDASGQLVDGGADLSMGGMCSYYHDLIYLAAIVQMASIFTDRSWWSFLLVSSPSCQAPFQHWCCIPPACMHSFPGSAVMAAAFNVQRIPLPCRCLPMDCTSSG